MSEYAVVPTVDRVREGISLTARADAFWEGRFLNCSHLLKTQGYQTSVATTLWQ